MSLSIYPPNSKSILRPFVLLGRHPCLANQQPCMVTIAIWQPDENITFILKVCDMGCYVIYGTCAWCFGKIVISQQLAYQNCDIGASLNTHLCVNTKFYEDGDKTH